MWQRPMGALAELLQNAERVQHASAAPPLLELRKRSNLATRYVGATDTACTSTASCKLKSLISNRCNFGREALRMAYQTYNIVAHTMGAAITVLCGCLFVEEQATCVLQDVPPACIFPYSVYSQLFAGSIQLWESVKASTRSCMMHGNSAVSS